MANRMLINATQAEEVRVAIVNGSVLDNLDIEILGKEQEKANIYKGKITRIERSLEALFVEYGSKNKKQGFLPAREVPEIYHRFQSQEEEEASESPNSGDENTKEDQPRAKRLSLCDRFVEGQELIIQVEKEARGNKGAALTSYVSLAGCYLVLMPLNPSAGGISRRIENEERAELREILQQLTIPTGMGVIVRTAGVGRDIKDLQWDLDFLVQQWRAIEQAANEQKAPFLIYQESNVVVRAIRDHLRPEINEILVDSPKVFEDVSTYVRMMRPDYITRVKLYNDSIPLFSRFQIESQIENAMQREIRLPSGGSVVIDHTEALISIDINSSKATKGGDIEETAFQTNLEAAECIARQLRLRDIGGLIVIDFIDMSIARNQRAVEQKLKEALEVDRARVQIGKISRFGLLEMSRQRLRPSLTSARDIVCPRCLGKGAIRGVDVLSINMIRLIEEEAIKDGTSQVIVEVPIEVATYLMNEKRQTILDIERKHHINVILVPSQHLETPNYVISRSKKDEAGNEQQLVASYTLGTKQEVPKNTYTTPHLNAQKQTAVVSNINLSMAPQRQGIIKRLISSILGATPTTTPTKPEPHKHTHSQQGNNKYRHGQNQQRGRNNRRNNNRPHRQGIQQSQQYGHQQQQGQQTQHENTRPQAEVIPVEQKQHYQQHQQNQHVDNNNFEQKPIANDTAQTTVNNDVTATSANPSISDDGGKNPNQQHRRRKQNRRRNHYRKGNNNHGNKVNHEVASPNETKVDE